MGFHDTGAMIGRFIGPISAGLMLAALGWQGIIRLWIIPSTILIGMLLIFKIDGKKIIPVERGWVAVIWSKSSYLYIAMTFVGVITASSGFLSLIPLYMAREFGMAPPLIAFIIGGTQLLGLFGAIIGGALSDVIGRFKILFTAMTVNVASIVVITYTPYGSLFLTGLIGLSVTISTFFAVIGATISDVTEMHETARRFGFIHAIGQIFGSGVSTVVIGFLAEYFGFQNAFVYPILLGSAGCICLPMFFRSLKSKN